MLWSAEHVLPVQNALGEGPLWHPDEEALYWVDIHASRVHRWHPESGQQDSFSFSIPITALARRASSGYVVATTKSLCYWTPPDTQLESILEVESDKPGARFNDGAVDPRGRFWIGTMKVGEATSKLYRLDIDKKLTEMVKGLAVSNGIGWSPNGRTMYLTDSMIHTIFAFDYDPENGTLDNRRVFSYTPHEPGVPDGLTVDRMGYVWSVRCGGSKVTRYDPDGRIATEIQLPVECPTSCTFGGRNLDRLYITSSARFVASGKRKEQKLAGDLFQIDTGPLGLLEPACGC